MLMDRTRHVKLERQLTISDMINVLGVIKESEGDLPVSTFIANFINDGIVSSRTTVRYLGETKENPKNYAYTLVTLEPFDIEKENESK